MIRVVIVDDQALMRAGFRALLDAEEGIDVVGEAADGRQGVEEVRLHTPDVVLLDVQMPVMTGIEATRAIASDPALADVHVVILTNYGLDEYVFDALRAGAAGFLLKDTEPAELLRAVEVAARGDALLSPGITRRLIGAFVSRPPDRSTAPGLDVLTRREREVTALAARGLTNDEIASHMVVSPYTAKTHISRAMTKLGARDRAQLVVFAYESGLVEARRNPDAPGSAPHRA
ncbi:response regulator [Streptomyces halstedii]|uniref:response regulator n=1 Tax=Streptomyces TaxID=1883 RepID=UPI00048DCD3A|nr:MULTISPECIES: response regulator transcription factor [Streptomyces]MYR73190.1 response regulator [Streptomyces sp. SID4925]MYY17006.1 response regulator [Streptomyces sp. SID4912]SBU92939.1 two component transcriptional regulator, LuxR family [Streptomyces sp. OspMP-M45]SCD50261.1 two component transcriptional regulator, LuxR family [Streptomyces sp. DpondAA-D4]SCE09831.1 two component transcriptional regulator, LuxR family [Streptomyces sp. PpalLS-921]